MKRLLTACLIAGLTGCAVRVWCNPNESSAQQLRQTQYSCNNPNAGSQYSSDITVNMDPHALRSIAGGGVNASGKDPFEFKACMEKEGYRFVTQKQCDTMLSSQRH